jgi:Flp pilus assembly protein TadD
MSGKMLLKSAAIILIAALAGCQAGTGTNAGLDENAFTAELEEGIPAAKHHFKAGNYGLSERNYRLAIENNPTNAEAWLGLGATYDQLGRYDLADRSYDQVMKIAGPVPQLMNNMGYSQMLRGKRKKAKTYLAKAENGLPDNETIIGNKELLARL